jgi:Fe-S cluster biosynthesis and repair protein YggX
VAEERLVKCIKLGKELPAMDRQPFKGELGERLFANVSKDAWRQWLEHSKMLINEYRLDMTHPAHQKTWFSECEKYFFGEGSEVPKEFKPVDDAKPGET